jgi:hypothetical protein
MWRVEIVELAGKNAITPGDEKADSTTELEKKEQFQYSSHA